jgi:hypothetical protein
VQEVCTKEYSIQRVAETINVVKARLTGNADQVNTKEKKDVRGTTRFFRNRNGLVPSRPWRWGL